MSRFSVPRWNSLEKGSPTLFLIAGVVLIIYAALYGVEASMGLAYPDARDFLLPTGYILGVAGLLGLYPTYAERATKLLRVGAIMAVGSLVGWLALLAFSFGDVAGGNIPQSDILPGIFFMVHPMMMILAYSLFALAIIWADFNSWILSLFLLGSPILFIVLLMGPVIRSGDFPLGAFVISSGQAMTHLAIGYVLQTKSTSPEREGHTSDDERAVLTND